MILFFLMGMATFAFFVVRVIVADYSITCAIKAVDNYSAFLIKIRRYNSRINYYGETILPVWQVILNMSWDKYAAVKPEYLDLLKPYFE